MKFTKEQLDSFITLYEKLYGEKLSPAKALEEATAVVSLVKMTYVPITKQDHAIYSKYLEKDPLCGNI